MKTYIVVNIKFKLYWPFGEGWNFNWFFTFYSFNPTSLLILNINYTIIENELTITSTGKLEKCVNYCPYHEFMLEVEKIIISDEVTIIEKDAFSNFENLQSVEIPESVTSFEDSAFQSCISLTTIVISSKGTEIGANCFFYCSSLKSVQLSNNITELPNGLFKDCTNLETVIFPNNLQAIEEFVFENCSSLKSISLPDNVSVIQKGSFQYCTSFGVNYNTRKSKYNYILFILSKLKFEISYFLWWN